MAVNIGRFNISISASARGVSNLFARVANDATKLNSSLNLVSRGITSLFRTIAVGGAGATAGFTAFAGFGVSAAAAEEQIRISFETIIGDAEKAANLIREITDFAAATPFQLPELQTAARQLLAFGVASDDVVNTLRRIGDVSAGISAPIGEIANIYGKARVQGRAFAEDINQFTGRGIPIIQELAKQFGVAQTEIKKLVEEGSVNFSNIERAFIDLTREGGKFFNLTSAQSQSFNGLWSTFKDNATLAAKAFGEDLLPSMTAFLRDGITGFQQITPSMGLLSELSFAAADALLDIAKNFTTLGVDGSANLNPIVQLFAGTVSLAQGAVIRIQRVRLALNELQAGVQGFFGTVSDAQFRAIAEVRQSLSELESRDFFDEVVQNAKQARIELAKGAEEAAAKAAKVAADTAKLTSVIPERGLKKLQERAKSIINQFQSPEQTLKSAVDEIGVLLSKQLVSLTVAENFTKDALNKYSQTTRDLIKSQENPNLLRRGSVESLQATNNVKLEKIGEEQTSFLAKAAKLLERIAPAIEEDETVNVTVNGLAAT